MAFIVVGLFAVLLILVLPYVRKAIKSIWLEPNAIRKSFLKQGIPCLPYNLFVGNFLDVYKKTEAVKSKPLAPDAYSQLGPRIFPFYYEWRQSYGDVFVFWFGSQAALCVHNPEHIKEILSTKFGHFKKMSVPPPTRALAGDSVATLEGEEWAQHRRIVSPAFFAEKLKGMIPTMAKCVNNMLTKWETQLDSSGCREIEVHEQFKMLTADVIAHTAFGSSYEAGKLVFKLQEEQGVLLQTLLKTSLIPGFRFLPTPTNRRFKWLQNEIEKTLMQIIKHRGNNSTVNDLLGILLAANRKELTGSQKNLSLDMQAIIDECKTFFFGGHETTTNLMTWTTMLLAINGEWQERARQEVLQFCGKECPTHESVNNLKLVGMVLSESLRLYPPAPGLMRETIKEIKIGDITLPPNVMVFMPMIDLHHDPNLWGTDAHEFNPQRFANGVVNACKNPSAYFPFSMGPRNCVGQNFALLEAKVILSMMLQRFRFSLSSTYIHSPITVMTVQPQHGLQIIVEKLL